LLSVEVHGVADVKTLRGAGHRRHQLLKVVAQEALMSLLEADPVSPMSSGVELMARVCLGVGEHCVVDGVRDPALE
jgi:hypothetical protein